MANEAILAAGAQITLEANGAQITDGDIVAANDASRVSTDNPGYPLGIFEFVADATDPWSGTGPTAGAAIHVYEQKIVGGSNDAPTPDAAYEHDYLWTFNVNPTDEQQFLESPPIPINKNGGKYFLKWVDGGAGAVSLEGGWALKLTPVTYGTA